MTTKTETPTPQRISVPQGIVLQIYSRDAHGNKMLMNLPGPLDVSMVPIERRENRISEKQTKLKRHFGDQSTTSS
jgi:hypothetical protein